MPTDHSHGSAAAGQDAGRPVAIAVAPNGGRRTKADHPGLPILPAEIGRAAGECLEAGAAMIHVHVRDGAGRHLLDADAYRAAIAAVRRECGDRLVVQVSTESVGIYGPAEQMAVVRDLRPEAASLALRELAPDASGEAGLAAFLGFMKRERIMPQVILYTPGDAARLADLESRGIVPFDDVPVLFVLGRYGDGPPSRPVGLEAFLPHAHGRSWMLCAFGAGEARCGTAAALLGGDVRVGFENNLHRPDASLAANNADLVEAVAAPLRALGVRLAGADGLRASWRR